MSTNAHGIGVPPFQKLPDSYGKADVYRDPERDLQAKDELVEPGHGLPSQRTRHCIG